MVADSLNSRGLSPSSSKPEPRITQGCRREGSCGGWNCCLLPFSPRAATHSAFPLCRPGISAGVLVSSEDGGARRAGCGGTLGATAAAPGTSWVTAWVMEEMTKLRSSRSSRASSFSRRNRSSLPMLDLRMFLISCKMYNRTSSGQRVRSREYSLFRTYRRVTSVAPSMENAMQYDIFLPHPSE